MILIQYKVDVTKFEDVLVLLFVVVRVEDKVHDEVEAGAVVFDDFVAGLGAQGREDGDEIVQLRVSPKCN